MRAGGVLWEGMGLGEDLARLRLVRGLSNDSGLNNCFLNVVIQALWHLRSFREALLALEPQARRPSCGPPSLCSCQTRPCRLRSKTRAYGYPLGHCHTPTDGH